MGKLWSRINASLGDHLDILEPSREWLEAASLEIVAVYLGRPGGMTLDLLGAVINAELTFWKDPQGTFGGHYEHVEVLDANGDPQAPLMLKRPQTPGLKLAVWMASLAQQYQGG
jgi:hypothetical protein